MDVSIVIPSYNSKSFLEETVGSALAQVFSGEIEVLIVDDCSSDGSYEFALDLQSQHKDLSVHQTPTNGGGPAWARNLGCIKAKGKYIAFLDSDDLWHTSKIQKQFDLAEQQNCPLIHTKKQIFPSEVEFKFAELSRSNANTEFEKISYKDMLIKNRVSTSSCFIKRDLILENPFKEEKDYIAVEDFDCWLRIHQKIGYSLKIQEKLLAYRVVATSISRNKWKMQKKVLNLLKNHERNHTKLGFKAYLYFFTHVLISIKQRL